MSLACLFPGQGSQAVGMGAALFDRYPDWTTAADDVLGYSIRALCVDDPNGELGLTAFTQPALYVVNGLTYRARIDDGQPPPAFVAGHSLGEYNALLAADVFDFETGLRLVQRRGAIMAQVSGGGMAAVAGLFPERIADVLQHADAGRQVDIANFNSFDQTVIAGPREALAAVHPLMVEAGARAFITLKVSAPFHSRYMATSMAEFGEVLSGVTLRPPTIPVIANATGVPYGPNVRDTLAEQIGSSVRWLDSMLYLLDQGVTNFEEVGPGTVLAKLLTKIRKARTATT
jgi:malonyl CoA-acyl carrier protein transacylase